MLSNQGELKLSNYSELYDLLVPKDNKYRKIDELIDFSFVYDELKDKYTPDRGRKAVNPIILFKYLMIKVMEGLSDVDVVEQSKYNLAYKRFLGLMPEDEVIDPSLLTKFRRQRLKDVELLDMLIAKTVGLAMEHNLIKSKTIIVDATHTHSKATCLKPLEVVKLRKNELIKAVVETGLATEDQLPSIHGSNVTETHLKHSNALLEYIESSTLLAEHPMLTEKVNLLKETIDDINHRQSLSIDKEARVGYKSAESSFFGYKTHIAINSERLITAACVTTGEKGDGPLLPELIKKTKQNGLEVDAVVGDMAYSGLNNLKITEEQNIKLVSKINPSISSSDEERLQGFNYIKDANRYICPGGKLSAPPALRKRETRNIVYRYRWYECHCKSCHLRDKCLQPGAKTKSISVRNICKEHQNQIAFQKTEMFRNLSKERYKIEAKNSELKNVHGYGRADSYGISALELQGAMTIFAVNVKRIMTLMAK